LAPTSMPANSGGLVSLASFFCGMFIVFRFVCRD
jgi:hypothetical protein